MSLFPQSLWRPSTKDLVADLNPEQRWATGSTNAAAASVQLVMPDAVPADKVFLVSSVHYTAVPGAAQSVARHSLRWGILNAGAFVAYGSLDGSDTWAVVANAQRQRVWTPGPPGFALMPGQVLESTATFDAGAAANAVAINAVGILIPRGNWQRT